MSTNIEKQLQQKRDAQTDEYLNRTYAVASALHDRKERQGRKADIAGVIKTAAVVGTLAAITYGGINAAKQQDSQPWVGQTHDTATSQIINHEK